MTRRRLILTSLNILFALILIGGSCGPVKPDPINPDDSDMCPAACDNLRRLGCEEGNDVYDPEADAMIPCEFFCLDTQGKGHALNPTCVAEITSCDQMDKVYGDPDFCSELVGD